MSEVDPAGPGAYPLGPGVHSQGPSAPCWPSVASVALLALFLAVGVGAAAAATIAWRGVSGMLATGLRPVGSGDPGTRLPDTTPSGALSGGVRPRPTGTAGAGSGPVDLKSLAATVARSLVDVNSVLGYNQGRAAGTGIVLTPTGLVLTNNHVVSGATSVSATDVGNGHSYPATVVGYDRDQDIAVLRLAGASGLPVVAIGDSGGIVVGDRIAAIGNAGGTGGTPSVVGGIVSALNQSIIATDAITGSSEQLTGLIQVDADVRPGDSGGPLVNASGRVLGLDTAASTGSGGSAGQGYAIPIASAMSIGNRIIAGDSSNTVHIGPTASLGVQVDQSGQDDTSGALVAGVVAASPAQRLGLAAGDVILALNGAGVDSPNTLTDLMTRYHPGDTVRLTWQDGAGLHGGQVRLAPGPVG